MVSASSYRPTTTPTGWLSWTVFWMAAMLSGVSLEVFWE